MIPETLLKLTPIMIKAIINSNDLLMVTARTNSRYNVINQQYNFILNWPNYQLNVKTYALTSFEHVYNYIMT